MIIYNDLLGIEVLDYLVVNSDSSFTSLKEGVYLKGRNNSLFSSRYICICHLINVGFLW